MVGGSQGQIIKDTNALAEFAAKTKITENTPSKCLRLELGAALGLAQQKMVFNICETTCKRKQFGREVRECDNKALDTQLRRGP